MLGVFMITPGQTVGVSVFIDYVGTDIGLPRERVLLLYSLGTLIGILPALTLVGWSIASVRAMRSNSPSLRSARPAPRSLGRMIRGVSGQGSPFCAAPPSADSVWSAGI